MDCNVVLSGSGIRFPYFVGALIALEHAGYNIKAIAGTSGGSIVAGTYAHIKDGNILKEEIVSLNLKEYVSLNWTFWKGYSIYKLKESKFRDKIISITKSERIEDAKIPLKIVTTNISKSKIVVAQKGDLVDWIIASISAPIVFRYKKIGKSYFVDGGLCKNLLADAWIKREEPTFLFYFPTYGSGKIDSFIQYISNLVSSTLSCNVDDEIEDVRRVKGRDIKIIPLTGYENPFGFKEFSPAIANKMISEGYKQTKRYLTLYT